MADKKILLSIGMIVKNEEKKIEKCLKALQPLRDAINCELVIADTGSTDKTREIAEKYADILFDFEWIDDFAAARNAVMDKCSGKWYLSVDADEYLDPNIDEILNFFKIADINNITSAFVRLHNYQDENDYDQYSVFYAYRLVKLSTGVRFYGKIHEVFEDVKEGYVYYLKKTIFWHDGYINNGILTDRKKGKRNIELLEKELESNPDDLLRNFQMLESAYNNEILCKYGRKVVELVDKNVYQSDILGPAAYRHAVRIACTCKLPEFDEWVEKAFSRYPESFYTRIDVTYFVIIQEMSKNNYDKVIELSKSYLRSIDNLDEEGRETDFRLGTLLAATKYHKECVALYLALAYAHIYKFEECKKILEEYQIMDISIGCVLNWLKVAYYIWQKIELTDLFENIGKAFYQNKELDKLSEKKKLVFEKNTKNEFMYAAIKEDEDGNIDDIMPDAPAYPLIEALGDCDLGNSAKIMQINDKTEIELLSKKIEDWTFVPNAVPMHILINCAKFPDKFYNQSANRIQDLAGEIVAILNEKFVDICLKWIKESEISEFALNKIWTYSILLGSMRIANWKDENCLEKYKELINRYINYSDLFINWYYNPNLLNEEMAIVLPSMHHFGWLMIKYEDAKKRGNQVESISWLRKALDVAPVMKNFINSLLKYSENEQERLMYEEASPELLMLAEKVKSILDNYPESDPIVKEIKSSDAYKKVAYLIENPKTRFKM